MLEHVRKSHPNLREPLILELDKSMPTLAEIHASWCKLRDSSCCPLDNIQKFWENDSRSLSLINGSRWPHHVMICLRMANRVVEAISQHQVSVVLQGANSFSSFCQQIHSISSLNFRDGKSRFKCRHLFIGPVDYGSALPHHQRIPESRPERMGHTWPRLHETIWPRQRIWEPTVAAVPAVPRLCLAGSNFDTCVVCCDFPSQCEDSQLTLNDELQRLRPDTSAIINYH